MKLKKLAGLMTVCKVADPAELPLSSDLCFVGKTEEELSLVCRTEDVPRHTLAREDGWRAFRVEGTLDFSLTGILSGLSSVLAEHRIGLFAVSTYNTDYILVREKDFDRAMALLEAAGYGVD